MIIVCSSQIPGDVRKALSAAKQQNSTATGVIQVSSRLYYQLKRGEKSVPKYWSNRSKNYKINLNTGLLHKKDCKSAKGRLVDASIINIGTTGLRKCKRCMKNA